MSFGNRLYDLRKRRGLSQEELGEKINVSRQTISKYELGEAIPDMEKLVMLSDYFSISLDELVLGVTPGETSAPTPPSFLREKVEALATEANKTRAKKLGRIILIVFFVSLLIDFLSLLIFFLVRGFPG